MINRIGGRGHDFGFATAKELSDIMASLNMKAVHLALKKAIVGCEDLANLDMDYISEIGQEFKKNDIAISVLGCYLNYGCEDIEFRNRNIEIFKKHLEYGKKLGARLIGTETGSVNSDYSFNTRNFTEEGYRFILDGLMPVFQYAEDLNVDLGIEAVYKYNIYDVKTMKRLIDDIGSKHFKVIFDPVNILTKANHENSQAIIDDAFTLFGDRIDVVHLKDYVIKGDIHVTVPRGEGIFNFDEIIKPVIQSSNKIDCIFEEATSKNIFSSQNFIKEIINKYS